jgi:hypothetical protein
LIAVPQECLHAAHVGVGRLADRRGDQRLEDTVHQEPAAGVMVRLGGARAHHGQPLDPDPGHRGGDVADAVAVDGDRLAGERNAKRRQRGVGSLDGPVDRRCVVHVGLHDDMFAGGSKARRYGFHQYVDTEALFLRTFAELRRREIIP